VEVVARWVAIAAFAVAGSVAFAGPFAEVPAGHPSYRDAGLLADSGLWRGKAAPASGLCRYDFAAGVLETVRLLSTPQPAKELPRHRRARLAEALLRLAKEYEDVLSLLGETPKTVAEAAKNLEDEPGTGTRADSRSPGADLQPVADAVGRDILGAHVGLTLRAVSPEGGPLIDRLLTETALLSAADSGMASPGAPVSPARMSAVSQPSLGGVGGSVQYSLSDSLSLSLAYSALTSGGRLLPTPVSTTLKTLGVGIRISPRTSLSLRYYLIERPEGTAAPGPTRSLAETELLVRF
jgi:hypothetical protein